MCVRDIREEIEKRDKKKKKKKSGPLKRSLKEVEDRTE